ncbi:MAG: GntR family transcriptional regulator [Alphaproteobacteria bacterium]|nr:GntR family transcriptional regulator [Alphaproteobacteria bacterium]
MTLNQRVYEEMKGQLLSGDIAPYQRLKTSALADVYGVSLNVVREVLNRLAGEGLVHLEPNLGFRVRGLSREDLTDLVEQRISVESIALRKCIARRSEEWQSLVLAAHHRLEKTPLRPEARATELNPVWLSRHDEFHRVMMEGCGSPRLFRLVRLLADEAELYHRALLPQMARDQELKHEHQLFVDAILDDDSDGAVAVLVRHLEGTRDLMLPLLPVTPTSQKAA